ncbi:MULTISPECIES: hypothetical protein [Chryseobacterium]|uniref:Anti-sigma factor n=1 Tax=Chryseobacterium camelliae TaxID=1265445 RepID=A0ABU0TMF1_9FLAO|nr:MULTISPECIES: hypothetical protein [Chryseobacterium]MDT3407920.1 hypothetical protein [Pseudacidovorax intermedius]MDQ1098219.1 hypothetical protein [Chryseobacterium camelliae]MDQ1102150.1 hypothetical protein [Chryseobacterium sp. SORGH_AS_1048]MDR6085588.1 hypothetical protein [Chryseobacterium sp. SORGH_AS_0909]MDR6129950.1 hypothetical protein [Chryseobacterium sp. SORGH_AS_1175]
MKEFDIEKLERKNIYKVPEDMFKNIQDNVMNDVKARRKAPVFKLNWAYAAAASIALVFGATFVLNSGGDDPVNDTASTTKNYAAEAAPARESEQAYEVLQSDLTSVEKNNQTSENRGNNSGYAQAVTDQSNKKPQTVKTVSKQTEAQMNEYLDSFSSAEISELANNSTQDVYLDLYN